MGSAFHAAAWCIGAKEETLKGRERIYSGMAAAPTLSFIGARTKPVESTMYRYGLVVSLVGWVTLATLNVGLALAISHSGVI
ncbi:hypothetical protein [Cupriavidus necator]